MFNARDAVLTSSALMLSPMPQLLGAWTSPSPPSPINIHRYNPSYSFSAMYNGAQIPLLACLLSCLSPVLFFYLPIAFAYAFLHSKLYFLSSFYLHGFVSTLPSQDFFSLYCSEFEASWLLYLAISLWMDPLLFWWIDCSRLRLNFLT